MILSLVNVNVTANSMANNVSVVKMVISTILNVLVSISHNRKNSIVYIHEVFFFLVLQIVIVMYPELWQRFVIRVQANVCVKKATVDQNAINVFPDFTTILIVFHATVPAWEVFQQSVIRPENVIV